MSSLASNVASFTEFYRVVPSCTEFYENCITAHHGLIKYRGNGRSGPQIGPSDVQWRNDLAPGHPADWPIADRRQFRSDQSRVLKDFLIPAPPSISNTTQNSLFTEFYRVLPSFTEFYRVLAILLGHATTPYPLRMVLMRRNENRKRLHSTIQIEFSSLDATKLGRSIKRERVGLVGGWEEASLLLFTAGSPFTSPITSTADRFENGAALRRFRESLGIPVTYVAPKPSESDYNSVKPSKTQ